MAKWFQRMPDGRGLFFPWGIAGSGYVFESKHDYNRLRVQISFFIPIGTVLPIAAFRWAGFLPFLAALAAVYLFYLIWMQFVLRGLQKCKIPQEESLSPKSEFQESVKFQARIYSPMFLWAVGIASIAFVVAGTFIRIYDPANSQTATACIIFFGLCATCVAFMLVLRQLSSD